MDLKAIMGIKARKDLMDIMNVMGIMGIVDIVGIMNITGQSSYYCTPERFRQGLKVRLCVSSSPTLQRRVFRTHPQTHIGAVCVGFALTLNSALCVWV